MRFRLAGLALIVGVLLICSSSASAAAPIVAPADSADPAQSGGGSARTLDLPYRSDPDLARTSGRRGVGRSSLKRRLKSLARQASGKSGYYVADLDAKKKSELFGRNAGKRRKLASNTKLFTTSTALHRLGPKGRIATKVKAQGKVNGRGFLRGSLYLIGGGDPSLGRSGMRELANDVRRSGIKRVKGTVIADDSVFDRVRGVPDSGGAPSPYIAPLSGLVYGGSTYSGDPAVDAGQAFRGRLRKAGVKIGGKVKTGKPPKKLRGRKPVGKYQSPTIASLAAATNKPSNNFFAEMLLKELATTGKKSKKGTTKRGTKKVAGYMRSIGVKVSQKDGSGLTRRNLSSPRDVVRLLSRARRDRELKRPFFDSLAVAGGDGTLASRMNGTVAAGRCRGKTGTISGVSALSGYCKTKGKRMVAFSLLMNGVGSYDSARNIQDRMVVEIARYRP